jgi:hypothetical protein
MQCPFSQNIEWLTSSWPELPSLRDLTMFLMSTWDFDLPHQHHILITEIMPKAPNVVRVMFTDEVCWYREDGWHPIAPFGTRKYLRHRVKTAAATEDRDFVDFDGLFASLFSPDEITDDVRLLLGLDFPRGTK